MNNFKYNYVYIYICIYIHTLHWGKLPCGLPPMVSFWENDRAWKFSVIAPTFNRRPKRTNRNSLPRCTADVLQMFPLFYTLFFLVYGC